jgi:uncharacterized protein (TIGR03437 family)
LIRVTGSAAGLFSTSMDGQGVFAGQVIYVHADGSQTVANSVTAAPGATTLTPNPIDLGTTDGPVYLVLYGTGLRNAAAVTAAVNGVTVPVAYFGKQGSFTGLDQVNLGPLPLSLAGSGQVNLVITVDGHAANTVTASVQ